MAVSKSRDLEVDASRSVIDNSLPETGWAEQEFHGVNLSDKRLDRRLIKTAELFAKSPLSPINEACGDWACTRAAYRLFNNVKATPQEILRPHQSETEKRMAAYGGTVLAVQDTVFFTYTAHVKTSGLGPLGKRRNAECGLVMHNALAFTTAGVPLGILSQSTWARKNAPVESDTERVERLHCTPIDEKESSKWLVALRETVERTPPGVKVITVADREADFFEFALEAIDLGALFLIRARIDRRLVVEHVEDHASVGEALAAAPVAGSVTVDLPGCGGRKPRTATVDVKFAEVIIRPPQRRLSAKISEALEAITLHVVGASESCPPAGSEAVSWVLMTNLPVRTFAAAVEKVHWYGKRWGIETWHKILKSGCRVEHCLLQTADRLRRYLTLFSIIGFRLMHVTLAARAVPDTLSTDLLSEEEVEALHVRVTKTRPPAGRPPTLQEAVRMIGSLGGHLGRKGDGEPGPTAIWRGLMRLHEDVEMLRAYKAIFSTS